MNADKITKKELLEIIESKDRAIDAKNSGIDSLKKQIDSLQGRLSDAISLSNKRQEDLQTLRNDLKNAYLQGLSDIKSISALLLIYETESMTHREKKYLGEKLRHVIDEIVKQRMAQIGFAKGFNVEADLPF